MCAISMISDYGVHKALPNIIQQEWNAPHWGPTASFNTLEGYQFVLLSEYNELMRKAKEYDEKTGQPDCPDPEKMIKMEEFCKKFESMGIEMFKLANELRNLLK